MSADVQPRKRKDKKKKKDERSDSIGHEGKPPGSPPAASMPGPQFTSSPSSQDEVMHVYKEGKIGGNMITKVLFFVIMTALAGTISIVILQHRGTVDIERDESHVSAESAWSLDLGLGDILSPFSFGLEEGDHGESHDEHGDEHAEEEHGHDEHSEHDEHDHHEEQDDLGFMSWMGWGGGSGEHVEEHTEEPTDDHDEHGHDDETESGGFGSWFGWGGGEEQTEASEEPAEASESGSWFGWGSTPEETPTQDASEEKDDGEAEDKDIDNQQDENEAVSEEVPRRYRQSIKFKYEIDDEETEDKEEPDDDEETKEKEEPDGDDDEDGYDNRMEEQEDDDDDDELATFLRSLDLQPPSRHYDDKKRQRRVEPDRHPSRRFQEEEQSHQHRQEERFSRREEYESERPSRRQEEERLSRRYQDIEDEEDTPPPPPRSQKHSKFEEEDDENEMRPSSKEEITIKRKKSVPVEDEGDDEMFPEAVEALRLEKQYVQETDEVKDEEKEEVEEEAPFSRDEETASEDEEAQGEDAKKGATKKAEEEEGDASIPVSVEYIPPTPAKAPEPVKEKMYESKARDLSGSAAMKASEFLAERAAERAREESQKQLPPVEKAAQKPQISIPPPPPLTPEPSDEEELSDVEHIEYSEGEEGVDEEEIVEEEELVGEESPLPSDDENQDLGLDELEGSDPEIEEEDVEEEESESEPEALPPPPPAPKKEPAVSETRKPAPTPSSRQDFRRGGPQDYEDELTNDYDWAIREELDMADDEFFRNPSGCLLKYQALLTKYDKSPRVHIGLAKCLDHMAKEANSNRLLEQAIMMFKQALKLPMNDKLFQETADNLIKRLRFRGFLDQTIEVHRLLVNRFGNEAKHRNDLAISYLMLNRLKDAEKVLNKTLSIWPKDAVARAHYGLALKLQGKHEESIVHLVSGIELDPEATKDARFYFHLGDALVRTGQSPKALKMYEKGVSLGLFRSMYQRSLYNIDRLEAKPWWTLEETTYSTFFRKLESNWKTIRDEGLKAIEYKKGFLDEAESLRDVGDWKQFELYARGTRNSANCEITPFTCKLISEFEPARGCRRGQVKFSLMEGGTHVWPHCGPTNCRLRAHLGLVVPQGPEITVANITRPWIEGKVIVFDDSFEHEVWHRGTLSRLVLIVDVWHPQITVKERRTLSPI